MWPWAKRGKETSLETSDQAPALSNVAPSSAAFPDGVKVWAACPHATVDICFVHGLTGDRDDTWTPHGQDEPWPKTLLPHALQPKEGRSLRARILTYGYDAYVVRKSTASTNRLREHADNLLNDIVMERDMSGGTSRPLIFVAHSLGGLVCKKAILTSRSHPEKHLQDLFQSLKGIIFMGTPHKGSWMADWAKFPAVALKVFKSTNASILEILQTKNQLLQDIQDDFWAMIREQREGGRRLEVTCFFEELPISGAGLVVDKNSATLEGYNHVSIHAHHGDMVKFSSPDDNGFKRLLYELFRWGKPDLAPQSQINDCLKSLAFPEMNDRVNDITPRIQGSLSWLSEHCMYKDWVASNREILWIRGKPGSGKSTLMQHALRTAEELMGRDSDTIVLSHFFHGRGTELQKTPMGLYRSLLHQILSKSPEDAPDLMAHFQKSSEEFGPAGAKWSWHKNQLWEFAKAALSSLATHRKVWLLIDGLDEAEESDAVDMIRDLRGLVESLKRSSTCRLCFASRHYPVLAKDFGFIISLEDENAMDITTYVQKNLTIFEGTDIRQIIIQRASGIFIWVRLTVERVLRLERQGMRPEKIKTDIERTSTDLNDIYMDILERIKDNPESVTLFEWVGFSKRPLLLKELCYVIDPSTSNCLEIPLERMELWLGSLGGGLIEFNQQKAQFIHQSFKDFYVSKGLMFLRGSKLSTRQVIGQVHGDILKLCFHSWISKIGVDAEDCHNTSSCTMPYGPLLPYAALAWSYHAREGEKYGVDQSYLLGPEYLDWPSSHRVSLMIHIYGSALYSTKIWMFSLDGKNIKQCPWHLDEKRYYPRTILHVLSKEGLVTPLRSLVTSARQDGGIDFDPRDVWRKTPFMSAVDHGQKEVVEFFLDELGKKHSGFTRNIDGSSRTPQINFNATNISGETALCIAIRNGDTEIVKLLLTKGKVDLRYLQYGENRICKSASILDYKSTSRNHDMRCLILKHAEESGRLHQLASRRSLRCVR